MRSSSPSVRAASAVLLCAVLAPGAAARELTLAEAFSAAENISPALKAARDRELSARQEIGVAQSAYSPSLAGEAVDSWGFPGGKSGTLETAGIVGSPYRSGAAAGLVAKQTLYDFGRTGADVRAARQAETLRETETALTRQDVDVEVLRTFDACSRFRSGRDVWDSIHAETELVAKEVARYVSTGQRSVVDRYLSEAQVEEARTNRNYYTSRMKSTLSRLSLLTGLKGDELECPVLPGPGAEPAPAVPSGPNPLIQSAESRVDLAKTRLSLERDDYLPKLFGIASVGTMERARLVNKEDWSGGLGLVVPLFDGLGTVHRVGRARADLDASSQELGAARLRVDDQNARYDEIIDASKARIEHLERELDLAREGFRVAKDRYFKYQGTLADMRDALRNLGRIENDMAFTRADLLEAVQEKALVNGGRP